MQATRRTYACSACSAYRGRPSPVSPTYGFHIVRVHGLTPTHASNTRRLNVLAITQGVYIARVHTKSGYCVHHWLLLYTLSRVSVYNGRARWSTRLLAPNPVVCTAALLVA